MNIVVLPGPAAGMGERDCTIGYTSNDSAPGTLHFSISSLTKKRDRLAGGRKCLLCCYLTRFSAIALFLCLFETGKKAREVKDLPSLSNYQR